MTKLTPALLLFIALTACGAADSESRPGGVSIGDARALDEAAEKLDAQAKPDSAVAAKQ